MELDWWEIFLRVGCAFFLGALVGFERQWRSRMAGLRTNALVATGAALFVLLSAGMDDVSPTRIAAQVVSGIGFLGAGVILRDGVNVRGLTTAATIWCVGAIGVLAGGGEYIGAAVGAGTVMAANLVLRPVSRRLERGVPDASNEFLTSYQLHVVCRDDQEAHVRALLIQALSGGDFTLRSLHSEHINRDDDQVTVQAELTTSGRQHAFLEQAVSRLSLEPGVSSVRWQALDEVET